MGRPKGSSPKLKPGDPNYKAPGRKSGVTKLPQYTMAQILEHKVEVLRLLCSGEAETISDAARTLGVDPARVHQWGQNDKDFQEMLRLSREVVADKIEKEFRTHKNFIPKMMLLKGYRQMFRDNYRLDVTNEALEKLLVELRELKEPKVEVITLPEDDQIIEGEFREIKEEETNAAR